MRVHFGDCSFDSDTYEVLRSGRTVSLSPKAFHLLEILIRERPKAIDRRKLHAELWPGIFVTDANLPNLVAELRSALGDNARSPHVIRTVRGFGYAFSASARAALPAVAAPSEGPMYRLIWGNREIALMPGENGIGRAADSDTLDRRLCGLPPPRVHRRRRLRVPCSRTSAARTALSFAGNEFPEPGGLQTTI